jgi:hypothetical protein
MSNVSHMSKIFLCLSLAFLISGCSTCFERKIYKPKISEPNKLNASVEEFNYTVGAVFEFGDFATIRVSECTLKPEGVQTEPQEICIIAKLDEMHSLKVPNAKLEVYSGTKNRHELSMGDWEYREELTEEINPITPTTATIKPKDGKTDFYTFEATALFTGASSKWYPPTQRALYKDLRRLEFTSSTKLPSGLGNQFYLKLPKVIIDGKEYALPTLEFNRANETFCYPHV